MTLQEQFGSIDIYLFDQLLRGLIRPGMTVLDAGCGGGRNTQYLLSAGYDVWGCDADEQSIDDIRRLARSLAPELTLDRFRAESIEQLSFPDAAFDVVICSAVLHFAHDEAHFRAMVWSLWRRLKPGGLFFSRLASDIGMEGRFTPIGGRRFRLLDGSDRFLVDQALLLAMTQALSGELVDPLKTTIVQDQRCMTTWVVRKPG